MLKKSAVFALGAFMIAGVFGGSVVNAASQEQYPGQIEQPASDPQPPVPKKINGQKDPQPDPNIKFPGPEGQRPVPDAKPDHQKNQDYQPDSDFDPLIP